MKVGSNYLLNTFLFRIFREPVLSSLRDIKMVVGYQETLIGEVSLDTDGQTNNIADSHYLMGGTSEDLSSKE